MLMIIAHHYVVNSNVWSVVQENPTEANSYFMLLFGAWGKTGINCFVFITGWFMCKSSISLQKFLKLVTQVWFYSIVFYILFGLAGAMPFTLTNTINVLLPVKNMNSGFTSAFIVFYLFIPFLTVWVRNLTQREHLMLAGLCLLVFTVGGSMPRFVSVTVNYVVHFGVLFIIASYIRFHGFPVMVTHRGWGWLTLLSLLLSAASVLVMHTLLARRGGSSSGIDPYFFISDSNKILAMTTALCSFMWFKDLKLRHVPLINALGGATFGVLLIHANSNAMRQWLWNDTVDCAGHFTDPYLWLYAPGVVLLIFAVCAAIDIARKCWLEDAIVGVAHRVVQALPFPGRCRRG